jgi:hypothetical protein
MVSEVRAVAKSNRAPQPSGELLGETGAAGSFKLSKMGEQLRQGLGTNARGQWCRLVAIDLDGTLLCPQGQVTPRAHKAIAAARNAGLVVCLATGRNHTESRRVLQALGYDQVGVFAGGAVIYDCGRECCVHRTLMDGEVARGVCEVIERCGHAALALQDTQAAGVDYLISAGMVPNRSTTLWMEEAACTVRLAGRLGAEPHGQTVRVGLVASEREATRVRAEIESRFGAQVYCHSIDIPQQSVQVMEVFHHSVNKWQAVCRVAAERGIGEQEIAAVGDGINDLHMLQSAALAVAMGNAHPLLLKTAHRVIASNAEDGLAIFLEELVAGSTAA